MGFAILGLKIPGITIKDPEFVHKSYPDFFNQLDQFNPNNRDKNNGEGR